ncbi:hypothetical protein [Desulfopila aestuarii]|uniref:Uncharacterized protein n=1 Tax=Desulfopila aestuarii DSM 18488 TaxID=1121416 RepID=A0A1M7YI12_9BACT|nr:hypothetical protein [Desulfopila aestuarii]SHO52272.1 hypothetical protein SAMN02745220_04482 [Desulfopila aestuarii DSM 18488]
MMQDLVVAWKNEITGKWTPVGKLSYRNSKYYFEYTEVAMRAIEFGELEPFYGMEETRMTYESKTIFPVFENRLLQKSRPEHDDYYDWLYLSKGSASPLDELARSGGIRATDNFQFFLVPKNNLGKYSVLFFSHGISHLANSYVERLNSLKKKDKLMIMEDIQNLFDPDALALRTEDPPELVGYTPRFFTHDFKELIRINGPRNIEVTVEKVNMKAPKQYKLLCRLTTKWPENFVPFKGLTKYL